MVKALALPVISERHHPLVHPLMDWSDRDLVQAFQSKRDRGCYFIALFSRYGPLVYSVLQHHGRSPVQVEYLYAKTWQEIFGKLYEVEFDLDEIRVGEETAPCLRTWIVNRTADTVHDKLPGIEHITYVLSDAPPPFWCYIETSLDYLPALTRLILVATQTFHWTPERTQAYLEIQGERLTLEEIHHHIQQGFELLTDCLPADVRSIYLGFPLPSSESLFSGLEQDDSALDSNVGDVENQGHLDNVEDLYPTSTETPGSVFTEDMTETPEMITAEDTPPATDDDDIGLLLEEWELALSA